MLFNWAIPGIIFLIFLLNTVLIQLIVNKIVVMTRFEPLISGVRSNCATNLLDYNHCPGLLILLFIFFISDIFFEIQLILLLCGAAPITQSVCESLMTCCCHHRRGTLRLGGSVTRLGEISPLWPIA